MTWIETWPVFLAGLALLILPGAVILRLGGVRGLNMLALAGPVSISVSACLAVVLPFLGLPFSPLVFWAASGIVAVLALLFNLWQRKRFPSFTGRSLAMNGFPNSGGLWRPTAWVSVAIGFLGGAFLIGRTLTRTIGNPSNFSQTFDNVFHLNAVKHIAETANGSSLTLGNLTETSQGFYPAGLHDMMALVMVASDAPVPVAVNVVSILISAVVWPLGCMYLVTRIVGKRPLPVIAAGLLSAGFSAFPYLLIGFGVLYSLFAAIALLPVALGLIVEVLGRAKLPARSPVVPVFWLVVVLPGVALTHPSALVALIVFAYVPLVARVLTEVVSAVRGQHAPKRAVTWVGLLALYSVFALIVWIKVRPDLSAAPWGAGQSTSQAIGEVIASAPMGAIAAWVMMIFTIIGAYVILRWRRELWWVLAIYIVAGVLYMFASGWGSGSLRTFMVGVWYNDPFRLAALLPLATLPIVVLGFDELMRWLVPIVRSAMTYVSKRGWIGRLSARRAAVIVLTAGTLVGVVAVAGLAQSGTLKAVKTRISQVFAPGDGGKLVDQDEQAVFNRLSEFVPEDGMIVANPFTGASLAYAIAGREMVAPHMFGDRSDDEQFLLDHWSEAAYNPAVCPIVQDLNAFWALDFGDETVIETRDRYLGVDTLEDDLAPGVEVLFSEGGARLMKLTVCEQ